MVEKAANGEWAYKCRECREDIRYSQLPLLEEIFQAYTRPCELSDEDLVAAEYKLLTETGLARIESVKILGEMRKSYNLFMTETAKQIISVQDPYQVDREKRRRSLIHLIAVAAVNVYGVIEKDLFINLFNHYSESPARTECSSELASFDPLSPDELESALSPYTELHVDVLLAGNHLMNRLIGGPEDIPYSSRTSLRTNIIPLPWNPF